MDYWFGATNIVKNHTHVKKVGHTSEFVFWHLLMKLKNNYLLKKKLFKWVNRKQNNIYNVALKKKNREKHLEISLFYTWVPKINGMIYSPWDIECSQLKLIILCHFLPFYSPKNPKNQNFEKMKITAGGIIV